MKSRTGRFSELDSMRGIAALIVVLGHIRLILYPTATFTHGLSNLLLYPLVRGHESVMFFFVLSGFVLALPFLRGKNQPYFVFILRRILRIYGPYLAALVLSIGACGLWHNRVGNAYWAAAIWARPVTLRSVVDHILFLGNYDYSWYNPVFWSLIYEMRISLLFPFLFLLTKFFKGPGTLLLIVACTLIGVQAPHSRLDQIFDSNYLLTAEYIGMFLLGILTATHLDTIRCHYMKLAPWQRVLFAVGSFLLYAEGNRIVTVGPLWHLGDMPIAFGATGFIIVGLNSRTASRALNSVVPTFLGRISYSLYLVHATVLFAMTAMLKDRLSRPAFLLLYLPAAILLSWGFYVAVEARFMKMSRAVGRAKDLST